MGGHERTSWMVEAAVTLFLCLVAAEFGLRLQQWIGPFLDLESRDARLDWVSDVVNHRPLPYVQAILRGKEMYGEHDGVTYSLVYDERGIRQPVSTGTAERCEKRVSILFLGDSFMQGYDVANSLPDQVVRGLAERYGICATGYNAGNSSYSPAIFIPLARRLMPDIRPDFVVIDVDETDLGDDVLRYEPLITRNARGENVGVRPSPAALEIDGRLIAMRSYPLYLQRLLEKLYIRFVRLPALAGRFDIFSIASDLDPDAEKKNAAALSIFRRNLGELVDVLAADLPSRDRILFIRHPHIEHLAGGEAGALWNDLAASTVRKVALANGARYFDATPDLRKVFGGKPQDFYWRGDMHFSFSGLEAYSQSVTPFIAHGIQSAD